MQTKSSRPTLILVANNPFGHHLLTSQLLGVYQDLGLDTNIILLCNGVTSQAGGAGSQIKVVSYASSKGGAFSYLNLLLKLIHLRWRAPGAVYHLRGFVAGALFGLSRLFLLQSSRYIYDPRGAFFIEWRESGRSKFISRVFGWIESRLIQSSVTTIVTSERFARLYRRLFRHEAPLLTIYNSTGFALEGDQKVASAEGTLRVVYLGTFNHWHDMDEVCRVMEGVARQVGPTRVELFVYTLPRFHEVAREKFGKIDCASLTVVYVNYENIPDALADKHIGISVVRPTLSSRIASPIKIADYIALGLIPLLNNGIGDFDPYFRREGSAILYKYGERIDMAGLKGMRTSANKWIYNLVSRAAARDRIAPVVERLLNG